MGNFEEFYNKEYVMIVKNLEYENVVIGVIFKDVWSYFWFLLIKIVKL